jgi:hypothetical protein
MERNDSPKPERRIDDAALDRLCGGTPGALRPPLSASDVVLYLGPGLARQVLKSDVLKRAADEDPPLAQASEWAKGPPSVTKDGRLM